MIYAVRLKSVPSIMFEKFTIPGRNGEKFLQRYRKFDLVGMKKNNREEAFEK